MVTPGVSAASQVVALFFFFNDPATTEIYTLSLHDALPILVARQSPRNRKITATTSSTAKESSICWSWRSEEHTSELQSRRDLVCRLLLEKKKKTSSRIRILLLGKPVCITCCTVRWNSSYDC